MVTKHEIDQLAVVVLFMVDQLEEDGIARVAMIRAVSRSTCLAEFYHSGIGKLHLLLDDTQSARSN